MEIVVGTEEKGTNDMANYYSCIRTKLMLIISRRSNQQHLGYVVIYLPERNINASYIAIYSDDSVRLSRA